MNGCIFVYSVCITIPWPKHMEMFPYNGNIITSFLWWFCASYYSIEKLADVLRSETFQQYWKSLRCLQLKIILILKHWSQRFESLVASPHHNRTNSEVIVWTPYYDLYFKTHSTLLSILSSNAIISVNLLLNLFFFPDFIKTFLFRSGFEHSCQNTSFEEIYNEQHEFTSLCWN